MALFTKEPEKNPKLQPTLTPQAPSASPSASITGSNPAPSPRAAAPAEGRAYLDKGSKVSGKISFEAPARIDGEVDGEINSKDSVVIGESAVVTAQIRAASVTVAGKVSGDIIATTRIEIRPGAKVNGNVTAPTLVIQEGALFEGHCSMQPEAHEERKVTVFPKEERLAQAAGGQKQA